MKEKTAGLLFVGLFSSGACLLLLLGCLALKRNYEWLAVFIIMGSLYMMLLVHASLVIGATKYELEKKTKQQQAENRNETSDSAPAEEGGEKQRKDQGPSRPGRLS